MPALLNEGIEEYAEAHTSAEPAHLTALAAETREKMRGWGMMVGQLEGRFLKLLVHLLQPQRILEIGTFTGYSSLSMAEALPPGGKITTLDINPEHTAIASRHIAASPYADRIEIVLGPAIESIGRLEGSFDFAFIDADKSSYRDYYEAILPRLSQRGAIAVDNVLWSGRVLGEGEADEDTSALRAFNAFVVSDPRVECVMVPIRDGVTLIRKR